MNNAVPVPGDGLRCMLMRGGTSKGLYFLADDLPPDPAARDALLLAVMGSGHPLQVDGVGGAHPLAAKVAVVSPSRREDADVDYLFLQLGVGELTITDRQNCGNILAGVGPFAVERGLIGAGRESTTARIHMVNSRAVVDSRPAPISPRSTANGPTPARMFPQFCRSVIVGSPTPSCRNR